jgi:calcineurin-like phosphoesterase family protein
MIFKTDNIDNIFFTSDTHFHHANILEFCSRPWGDIKIHDEALIQNWNDVVPEDGIVFHGGDLIWTGKIDWIKHVVGRLNGRIYLTLGNHDYQNRLDREVFKSIFADVQDMYYILPKDVKPVLLCHYPLMYWRSGYIHLHGHVHSGPNSTTTDKVPPHPYRYDIGVDAWDYKPVSYHKIKELINEKSICNV